MPEKEVAAFGIGFVERMERRYPVEVLAALLVDRTTGGNILWADDEYETLGEGYQRNDMIALDAVTGVNSGVIKPRIAKETERQSQRTRSHAEVFTPSWLCNRMNNHVDNEWFGHKGVFNTERERAWEPSVDPVSFPRKRGRGWQAYVSSPRLEITCGEAPFICSRYDTVTGRSLPVKERIGFLDRKLRVVAEKAKTRADWTRWALRALKATYGYEYQGDNVMLARMNVLETFAEHCVDRWGEEPTDIEIAKAAHVISWNLWQMDGRTCAVPLGDVGDSACMAVSAPAKHEPEQMSMFDLLDGWDDGAQPEDDEPSENVSACMIYDWDEGESVVFASLKSREPQMKKFYAVIGNPPYQETVEGSSRSKPIYNFFMEAAYKVGDKVELITPARFLFESGLTPKMFNQKMLNDEHLKVEQYYSDGAEVFPNTDIKGGVAITYRDRAKKLGPIRRMYKDERHRSIVEKVTENPGFVSLMTIVGSQGTFKYTDDFFKDNPSACAVLKKGTKNKILSSQLDEFSFAFSDHASSDCVRMLGRIGGGRVYRWINVAYVEEAGGGVL